MNSIFIFSFLGRTFQSEGERKSEAIDAAVCRGIETVFEQLNPEPVVREMFIDPRDEGALDMAHELVARATGKYDSRALRTTFLVKRRDPDYLVRVEEAINPRSVAELLRDYAREDAAFMGVRFTYQYGGRTDTITVALDDYGCVTYSWQYDRGSTTIFRTPALRWRGFIDAASAAVIAATLDNLYI